jgi:hypothetical protein
MERVDEHGQVVDFSILGVSRFRKERPFEAELASGKGCDPKGYRLLADRWSVYDNSGRKPVLLERSP